MVGQIDPEYPGHFESGMDGHFKSESGGQIQRNLHLDDILLIKYLGASLAHLSNCYLRQVPDTRGGLTHPDLDDRLRAVIEQVKLNREADIIQFHAHLSVGLQLFLHLTGKPFIPEDPSQAKFERFEDIEQYLFKLITEMKEGARNQNRDRL